MCIQKPILFFIFDLVFKIVSLTRSWCCQSWEQLSWHFKMNGLVIIYMYALGLYTHTCDIYVPAVRKVLRKWIFVQFFNFSLNGTILNFFSFHVCLVAYKYSPKFSTNFGEYRQALTLLIKHWEFFYAWQISEPRMPLPVGGGEFPVS